MNFKKIGTKMLVTILPVLVLAQIVLTIISATSSNQLVDEKTQQAMEAELKANNHQVEGYLRDVETLADAIAIAVADSMSYTEWDSYEKMLQDMIATNDIVLGSGLWFEPYAYDAEQKYYGPYVYKDGGNTVTTWDYSNSEYDYNQDNIDLTKYCNNSDFGYNGFTDNLTTLLPEDDAATANWGNGWRTPTLEEISELYNNTTKTWTQQNGVNGHLFIANNGNGLFLPAAGAFDETGLDGTDEGGVYWLSSLDDTDLPYRAMYFNFGSSYFDVESFHRYCGFTIRPVRSAK